MCFKEKYIYWIDISSVIYYTLRSAWSFLMYAHEQSVIL